MKHYLALALYYFGDGISRLVEKYDWYWLHSLYTKVMLLSGDLDTESRIWQREPYMAGGKCRYSINCMSSGETGNYLYGRIDVRGGDTDIYYGDEISVPPMRSEDWNRFGDWLRTVETDFMWTLDQLVEMYERENPKIRWADNEQKNQRTHPNS